MCPGSGTEALWLAVEKLRRVRRGGQRIKQISAEDRELDSSADIGSFAGLRVACFCRASSSFGVFFGSFVSLCTVPHSPLLSTAQVLFSVSIKDSISEYLSHRYSPLHTIPEKEQSDNGLYFRAPGSSSLLPIHCFLVGIARRQPPLATASHCPLSCGRVPLFTGA
jgi:hypothetical protein